MGSFFFPFLQINVFSMFSCVQVIRTHIYNYNKKKNFLFLRFAIFALNESKGETNKKKKKELTIKRMAMFSIVQHLKCIYQRVEHTSNETTTKMKTSKTTKMNKRKNTQRRKKKNHSMNCSRCSQYIYFFCVFFFHFCKVFNASFNTQRRIREFTSMHVFFICVWIITSAFESFGSSGFFFHAQHNFHRSANNTKNTLKP